ncbi:hypothetical protein ABZ208_30800 [Streptomyces sp. NPDC006208]|uniref:hypothetical protein n=1 Tax=Streptomyces sp. NPDC006208 TaxID=3156734 RepID=UPI0033B3FDD0
MGQLEHPLQIGTPDANGEAIPDIWAVKSDDSVRFYASSKTALAGSGTETTAPAGYRQTRIAIG